MATCGDFGGRNTDGSPCGRRVDGGLCYQHADVAQLVEKEARFVEEYLVDLNAAAAAARAGYSERSAAQIGWDLLQRPRVQESLREAMAARARRTEITADRVLLELARVAFADVRSVAQVTKHGVRAVPTEEWPEDDALAVAEVGDTKHGVRVKMHSKLSALDKIARHLGLFSDRLEVTGRNGGPIEVAEFSDAELRKRATELANRIAVFEGAVPGDPSRSNGHHANGSGNGSRP